jgi:Kef-type K+ transport system membrane component KefB
LANRVLGLALALGAMFLAAHARPASSGAEPLLTVASLGFLLIAGDLSAQLLETLGLPHLTGYLGAGIVAGPYVLGLIPEASVVQLHFVNGLALSLIAFSAGAELTSEMIQKSRRSIGWGVASQSTVLFLLLSLTFLAASPYMAFLHGQPLRAVIGVALLWGVVAVVKSPAAVLGVLAETDAAGPLTRYSIGMVVVLDVVVLVLFQLVALVARPLIDPTIGLSLVQLAAVGRELLSSVALGATLGLATALYLAWVDRGVILFLIALAFAAAQLDSYFGYDAMLVFAVAGFIVQNLTVQGEKLLRAIRRSGSLIFVVFFANAGAHLDLVTLVSLWPVALVLVGARAVATAGAAALGSRLADDPPAVQRWGWAPLISQAGIALGIAVAVEEAFPELGKGFRSLAVAAVGLNEAVGPILFKLALVRSGEVGKRQPVQETVEEPVAAP